MKVDFKFSKDFSSYKKGDVRKFRGAHARSLQDVRKVGKIVKPGQDKVEPKVKQRATK